MGKRMVEWVYVFLMAIHNPHPWYFWRIEPYRFNGLDGHILVYGNRGVEVCESIQHQHRSTSSGRAHRNHFIFVFRTGDVVLTFCRCQNFCHAENTYAINETRAEWKQWKYVWEYELQAAYAGPPKEKLHVLNFMMVIYYQLVGVERYVSHGVYICCVEIWCDMEFQVAHTHTHSQTGVPFLDYKFIRIYFMICQHSSPIAIFQRERALTHTHCVDTWNGSSAHGKSVRCYVY